MGATLAWTTGSLAFVFGMEAGLPLAILLFVIGIVLVMAEIFIPSGGALTILSVIAVGGAVVSAFFAGMNTGLIFLGAVIIAVPIVIALAFKLFPNTPIGRMMIAKGFGAGTTAPAIAAEEKALMGQVGTTRSTLRPSGTAEIAGDVQDVVAESGMIDKGVRVQVIEVSGNRIVVRALD